MVEQLNPTTAHELPYLYEQSQLTFAHWQEVLNRIDPQHEKVIECVNAIIEGRINEASPYLLKADWQAITTIDPEDITKTPKHFSLHPQSIDRRSHKYVFRQPHKELQ